MFINALAGAVLLMLSTTTLFADPFIKVDLDPIQHAEAFLVVVDANGDETRYSPAQLEGFPTYRLTTTTPWRETAANFEGVLLSEILVAHGLDRVANIRIIAEDDYVTQMDQDLLQSVPILVVTRVNGDPHDRRMRGPIQFVIDSELFAASELTSKSNFVWMAARIEAGD